MEYAISITFRDCLEAKVWQEQLAPTFATVVWTCLKEEVFSVIIMDE